MMARWCSKHHQYAESCTECKANADTFFNGFEPKTIKVDPIGPQAELLAQVAQLQTQVSAEELSAAKAWSEVDSLKLQVAQLQTTISQLQNDVAHIEMDRDIARQQRDDARATISTLTAALEKLQAAAIDICPDLKWEDPTWIVTRREKINKLRAVANITPKPEEKPDGT